MSMSGAWSEKERERESNKGFQVKGFHVKKEVGG
jgi:hypothetical protein